MSVPEYVPASFNERVRRAEWEVPPLPTRRRPIDHPGAPTPRQAPQGRLQGRATPDAGYALLLARRFSDRLALAPGEDAGDAMTAGAYLGMARASRFGRGPVADDVEVGLELLGYLGGAPADLVEWRRRALERVTSDPVRQLQLLGTDPELLAVTPGEARPLLAQWRRLLPADLPGVEPDEGEGTSHEQLRSLLGDGRDPERVRRFAHELNEHLAAERPQLLRLPPAAWAVIKRGQERLQGCVAGLQHREDHAPASCDTGSVIDLLALQALAEEEALDRLACLAEPRPVEKPPSDPVDNPYAVEWSTVGASR